MGLCLVSIILTTFNRMAFLPETVESIFAQDYKNFELLIIDDGSKDKTLEVIHSYLPIVKYIRHLENKGVSTARNTGIRNSRGQFICFIDSDDLWKKKKLSSQVSFFSKNPHYSICYTNEIWLKNGIWMNQRDKHKKYSGSIFEKLLPLCLISPSSIMLKRKVFDQVGVFDESFPACEDYDL